MLKKAYQIVILITLLLALSGVILYSALPATADDLPKAWYNMARQWHGALAMLGLMALGYMLSDHIEKKWRYWRKHVDGVLHLLLWLLLVVSGFLLYYPPTEGEWPISAVHWWLGIALCLWFPLHSSQRWFKQRQRRSKR